MRGQKCILTQARLKVKGPYLYYGNEQVPLLLFLEFVVTKPLGV